MTITRADLAAATSRSIPDVIAPGLHSLCCGINPGLYSGATRHHFARPGHQFWPASAPAADRAVFDGMIKSEPRTQNPA